MSGGSSMQEKAAAEEERRVAANEMKNSILSQVLTQGARARCKLNSKHDSSTHGGTGIPQDNWIRSARSRLTIFCVAKAEKLVVSF